MKRWTAAIASLLIIAANAPLMADDEAEMDMGGETQVEDTITETPVPETPAPPATPPKEMKRNRGRGRAHSKNIKKRKKMRAKKKAAAAPVEEAPAADPTTGY